LKNNYDDDWGNKMMMTMIKMMKTTIGRTVVAWWCQWRLWWWRLWNEM